MMVLVHFAPIILTCQAALMLSINYERQYFTQSSEGGYIIFWDIDEKIKYLINISRNGKVEKDDQGNTLDKLTEKIFYTKV